MHQSSVFCKCVIKKIIIPANKSTQQKKKNSKERTRRKIEREIDIPKMFFEKRVEDQDFKPSNQSYFKYEMSREEKYCFLSLDILKV